jgi:hypothetical protein
MNASLTRRAVVLASLLAIAAPPIRAALAADPAQPTDAPAPNEADRLFAEGVEARKAGKLAEAEVLFLKAWALKKTWDIAANLGLVEFKLGKLAEGARHVTFAIANLPPTESDATRESLSAALAAARPDIGEVRIACDVDGAEVRVGGKLEGTTPLPASLFAAPGQLVIEIRKDGYEPGRKAIEVKKGSVEDVTVTLTRRGPPPGPSRLPAYVAFGVGGAGLVLGAITGGIAAGQMDGIVKACGSDKLCPKSAAADLDATNTLANVSNVSFVVAGVGAGVGVTLLLLPGGDANTKTSLVVGPSFVGVKGAF